MSFLLIFDENFPVPTKFSSSSSYSIIDSFGAFKSELSPRLLDLYFFLFLVALESLPLLFELDPYLSLF